MRHERARHQHGDRQAENHPAQAHGRGVDHGHRLGVGLARPVVEQDGVPQQHDRQQEVDADELGPQVHLDRDLAHDGLADHAGDQSPAQPREVTPVSLPHVRAHDGGEDRHRDEGGDQAVPVLDAHIRVERGDQLALRAVGPGRAAQARAREANGGPGHDDGADRHRGRWW